MVVGRHPDGDCEFWRRMNSLDSAVDLPTMSTLYPVPRSMPLVEVFLITPAGKPVYHFSHGVGPRSPDSQIASIRDAPFERPEPEILALCATLVAFADVASDVQSIRTASGLMFFASTHSLYVAAVSLDMHCPLSILTSMSRICVAFTVAVLSKSLVSTLKTRPSMNIRHLISPHELQLDRLLRSALAYPLPYSTLSPPALPCPTKPASRSVVADMLSGAILTSSSSLPTHALLVTASAPFPRKIVAVAAPSDAPLTSLDIFVLTSMLPHPRMPDTAKASTSSLETLSPPPSRIFLQSTGHSTPYAPYLVRVDLRLQADDYDAFRAAVGGASWRPEWGPDSGGDALYIITLARIISGSSQPTALESAKQCAARISDGLFLSRASRDLIVALERPLSLADLPTATTTHGCCGEDGTLADEGTLATPPTVTIPAASRCDERAGRNGRRGLRGIAVLSRERIAATLGATDHVLGAGFADALLSPGQAPWSSFRHVERVTRRGKEAARQMEQSRSRGARDSLDLIPTDSLWCVCDGHRKLRIFGLGRLVMAAFDLCEEDVRAEEDLFVEDVVPWAVQYEKALVSEFDRVALPPRSLLGNLLTPFSS